MRSVTLDDKYTTNQGRVFINGNQALVRLLLLQRDLDESAGLKTSGFVSGYRGSPLGRFDSELSRASGLLSDRRITFRPAVNEDLAATAVWGTQQLDSVPGPEVDGVFGMWYGKGPGVDRSGDALKHGNMSGTHRHGGALVVFGDDHPGKSSTTAHQSEQALAAGSIPVLFPATVQEIIEYGLLGWAMSRYAGLWVGLKTVNETIEQTATVQIDQSAFAARLPEDGVFPEQGVHHVPGRYDPQGDDVLVTRYKLPLVHDFVRANTVDKVTLSAPTRRLGIVSAGKAHQDVLQALSLLGIDKNRAESLGISVYKVGCIWPLEPGGVRDFARGQEELLVVEEKKPFLEDQVAKVLINEPDRARLLGKFDEHGNRLLPSDVQLEPVDIAQVIAARLARLNVDDSDLRFRVQDLKRRRESATRLHQPTTPRIPYFCSGCPHNTSTRLPDGSFAGAGIGCHGMAIYIVPGTQIFTQMGGEGATWLGLSGYTRTQHVFQNLGDGTYYHSGLMAIRAAVAAGVNITYKILYNDAVAMTGGQPVDGPLSVADISRQVVAEGVSKCVVVSENPDMYGSRDDLAEGVEVFHRDELDRVQRMLRDAPGCTVLIYEQTCAVEKRRRRRRGQLPDPGKRIYINEAVCEGCGDCSVQANCVSIQPRETRLGRKRRIDQSSCNIDLSCNKGFCPSFVTVIGGRPRKPPAPDIDAGLLAGIPEPQRAEMPDGRFAIMMSGVGGTGVMTASSILGMAAHLEEKSCSIYDMTGLAQKNGAVFSHLRIASEQEDLMAPRIGIAEADLALAFDLIAAAAAEPQRSLNPESTRFVGNSHVNPTAMFQKFPDMPVDSTEIVAAIQRAVGEERLHLVDATGIGRTLLGDSIAANMFTMGFAVQRGLLPLGVVAIETAIELNGMAVEFNLQAFRLGRMWAWQPQALQGYLAEGGSQAGDVANQNTASVVAHRVDLLTKYQGRAYAGRYAAFMDEVIEADLAFDGRLQMAVAQGLAKLMAYKDEYEVARLFADDKFMSQLAAELEGEYTLRFNLAPPLLARRDPNTGQLLKREFGGWLLPVFGVLAKLKRLRGTRFDPFGWSAERRQERQLIVDYETMMRQVLEHLSDSNYDTAVELAQSANDIRGFGHVKQRNVVRVKAKQAELLDRFGACRD